MKKNYNVENMLNWMKTTKKIQVFILFYLLFFNAIAQSGTTQLPTIIPPDPVSSQFQKFLGYPVSPATGMVDVDIPLYNLQFAGVSIPFSLKYYSSGIKVDDSPGTIGYGWSLFPGLRISRTVMGNPDDLFKTDNIKSPQDLNVLMWGRATDENYLMDIAPYNIDLTDTRPTHDGQFDIFTLHLPTAEATFVLEWVNGVLKATPTPDKGIKIEPLGASPISYITSFKVTDNQGVVYKFGATYIGYTNVSESLGDIPTEWMLYEIDPPGGNNTITLTYQHINSTTNITEARHLDDMLTASYPYYDASHDLHPSITIGNFDNGSNDWGYDYSLTKIDCSYEPWGIKAVNLPTGGKIDFNYNNMNMLTQMNVTNQVNQSVRSITFSQTNNLMNSLSISGGGNYAFEYDQTPFTYHYGQDYSGYYNGIYNGTLIPSMTLDAFAQRITAIPAPCNIFEAFTPVYNAVIPIDLQGANREPDEAMMQSHILKKVSYPTGGYSSFTYEAHHFLSDGQPSFGMGLRVAGTSTYDPVSNKTITKTYKYGENETGLGNLGTPNARALGPRAFVSESLYGQGVMIDGNFTPTFRRRTISSNSNYGLFNFNTPIWYSQVTEYSDGGKIIYKYDYTPSYYYNHMVVPAGTSGYSNLYTDNYVLSHLTNLGSEGPRLTTKQFFNGNGTLVHETTNAYYPSVVRSLQGVIVKPVYYFFDNIRQMSSYRWLISHQNEYYIAAYVKPFVVNPYLVDSYALDIRYEHLQYTTEKSYLGGQQVETTTAYSYDSDHQYNVTEKEITTSDNGTVNEKYYYPVGTQAPNLSTLSSTQQNLLVTLINGNYLSTPIQKETYKNSSRTSSELYGYKDWGNSVYKPEQLFASVGSNTPEARIQYYNYDSYGNPQSVVKDNTTKIIYLWSYSGQYPVAKIEGISYADMVNSYFSQSNIDVLAQTPAPTDGQINAIRTALGGTGALITTYTYKPLVGITSMTDPRGVTTNYSYDTFNRLFLARNDDKNIIGRYRYGYQNAPDNGQGGYSAPAATVTPGATSYNPMTTGTATLGSVSGGSGSYTYSWYLKNSTGTVLASNLNTTSTSFSFICSQGGQLTIQCMITDNTTGISSTPSTTITSGAVTVYGSFYTVSGYTYPYTSLSKTGSYVTFVLVFLPTSSPMSVGTDYHIANVSAGFLPSGFRYISYDTGGRTWNITFDPSGNVYCRIVSGTNLPVGSAVALSSLTYNL